MDEKSIEREIKLLEALAYGLDKNITRVWAKQLKPVLNDREPCWEDKAKPKPCECDIANKIQDVSCILTKVIAMQTDLQIRLEL